MKLGRIEYVSKCMAEKSYSYQTIAEVANLLSSFENATIKTHFFISQMYVRIGAGKKALEHLLSVRDFISDGKLEASTVEIKKLNTATDLCRSALKHKNNIIANKLYEDYCL